MDISKLFMRISPKDAIQYFQELLNEFKDSNFINKYYNELSSRVEIRGKGFKPVGITLGGLFSIGGLIVGLTLFKDTLKYIITSPQVEQRAKMFELSNDYFKVATEVYSLKPIIVNFEGLPSSIDAEKLLNVLREGAIILQGVSAELSAWLGANSGCGRLLFYRPVEGKALLIYL